MKYLFISIIIILILLLIYLIFYKFNIEKFDNNKKDDENTYKNNIEISVDDAYIPSSKDNHDEIENDYNIIKLYKDVLEREPTKDEIKKAKKKNIHILNDELLNSPEYNRLINMQSNDVNANLEGEIAKEHLLKVISNIYKKELEKDIVKKMLLPLRDIFIYLQYNTYLLRSLLIHDNYEKFENDVINTVSLTKDNLLKLFNKYFDLLELKLKANDIIKTDKLKNKFNFFGSKSNDHNNNAYIDNNTNISINITSNNIKNALKNSDKIFNKDNIAKALDDNHGNLVLRMNKPIEYHNLTYKGTDIHYRPPICNDIGIKSEVSPIIFNNNINGTDIKTAFNSMQVGSIMPNFIYKEFKDIKIN